jgi:hypothetical protein
MKNKNRSLELARRFDSYEKAISAFRAKGFTEADLELYLEWVYNGAFDLTSRQLAKYITLFTRLSRAWPAANAAPPSSHLYRGLSLSARSYESAKRTGEITLRSRTLTSWTYRRSEAEIYAAYRPTGGCGIILVAPVRNVLVNLGPAWRKSIGYGDYAPAPNGARTFRYWHSNDCEVVVLGASPKPNDTFLLGVDAIEVS